MNTHAPEDVKQSSPEDGKELSRGDVTRLLLDWNDGDAEARDRLVTLVYDELWRMAHQHLLRERVGHTMRTGTLVHEVYLRLVKANDAPGQDHKEFFGVVAKLMRWVLVDAARNRRARKRPGNRIQVSLEGAATRASVRPPDLVKLDEALADLAEHDKELSQVVELRYFAGYTIEETAKILGVSIETVKRRWTRARTYLYDELTRTKEVVHVVSDDTPKE